MDELLKAIKTLYSKTGADAVGVAAAALRSATTGGLWLNEAPQSATGVYVCVYPISGPVDYAMGGTYTQDCDVQFTLATLDGTAAQIATARAALEALYDFCSLTMSGKTLLVARRRSESGIERDPDTRGYMARTEYRFMVGG